jgi:hypothetical protein
MLQKIGRRIFYEIATGNVIVDTGEKKGFVQETTIEQDILSRTLLSERNRDTFDVIELPFGKYNQDFFECNGYRVNPEMKTLEFSYLNPNLAEPQEPVYQKPLTEQVSNLENRTKATEDALLAIMMGGM